MRGIKVEEASPVADYMDAVVLYRREHPRERPGQALFNVAWETWPEETNAVRREYPQYNPFYDNAQIFDFLRVLFMKVWGREET